MASADLRRALGLLSSPAGARFVSTRLRGHARTRSSILASRLQRGGRARRPSELNVELTTRCNLSCSFCSRQVERPHAADIAPEIVARALSASGARELRFSGQGEPSCSPSFGPVTHMARARGVPCSFVTNGVLLGDALQRGLDLGAVRLLTVSLDAATPGTFRALRRTDAFSGIIEGLQSVARYRRTRPTSPWPFVTINWILMRSNLDELPMLLELAGEHGLILDAIHCYPLVAHIPAMRDQVIPPGSPDLVATLDRARGVARVHGIDLRAPFYSDHGDAVPRALASPSCPVLWEAAYLRADGEYLPCCEYDRLQLGRSFDSAWNGSAMRSARRRALRRELPFPFCRNCHKLRGGSADDKLVRAGEA